MHGMSQEDPSGEHYSRRFVLTGTGDDVREAQESLLEAVRRQHYDDTSCFAIRLAVEEALTNAFTHGNRNAPGKTVTMDCSVGDEAVVIDVADEGSGFDAEAVPDPTAEENISIPAGRGLVLMRAFMTEVSFQPPGNRVRLTYVRAPRTSKS